MMIRPRGKQPKPVLIFKGSPGYWEEHEERESYDPDVGVHFQKKAWADRDTCNAWAKKELKTFLEEVRAEQKLADDDEEPAILLLADNLDGQTHEVFRRNLSSIGAELMLGPPNTTDIWQPVDHHIGAYYHRRMGELYDQWMSDQSAHGGAQHDSLVPAPIRRIVLTEWAGQCYRELEAIREKCEQEGKPSIFELAFVDTGCMITADMSGDDKIEQLEKIQRVRPDLKLKSQKELLKEIKEEDRVREPFILYFDSSSDDDDDDDERGDEVDEVVDRAETLVSRPWQRDEKVRAWGDDFLSAVNVGQESRVDKEADHQILCLYEEKVAQWKSDNPKKNMTGKVRDQLHTEAIVEHSSKSGKGRRGRATRARKLHGGMVN